MGPPIVPPNWLFLKGVFRLIGGVKKVPRIQNRIAEIFEGTPVKFIRSAFRDDVDYRSRISPVFGFRIRKNCLTPEWNPQAGSFPACRILRPG